MDYDDHMTSPSPRNTTRQREAGAAARAETARRLLAAAGEEFAERGYHAATVSRIARRAGVTVQTLYLAWGSKRALLRAQMEAALSGNPDVAYEEELPRFIAQMIGPTGTEARAIVAQIAKLYRSVAERAALGWRLYRDAAATDPEIAVDWQALHELRRGSFAGLVRHIPAEALRDGVTTGIATDTAWAIASPETYELLVRTAGYTLDQYEAWVADTLAAALLGPSPTVPEPLPTHGTSPHPRSQETKP